MDLLNSMVQPDMSELDVDLIYTFRAPHICLAESLRGMSPVDVAPKEIVSLALPAMFNIPGSVQFYAVEEGKWRSVKLSYDVVPGQRIDVVFEGYWCLNEIKAVVKRLL
jgi:alpha-N-acetylglucosamine transferase